MKPSNVAVGLGLLLEVASLYLLMHNVTVNISAADYGDPQPAGDVRCSIAPCDAGFFGNDAPPGGEHLTAFSDEVASDCYTTNLQRFRVASAAGGLAVALLLVGGVSPRIRSSRASA